MTARIKTDELSADLDWLRKSHGLNDVLFDSLLASKGEARAHLKFFKQMVFVSNIAVMTIGLCLIAWGFGKGFADVGIIRLLIGIIGIGLFVWFGQVFIRGIKSVKAAEGVARKHGLI